MRCPPDHLEYGSEQLADNAAWLHGVAHGCDAVHTWPCGDHYHMGHVSKVAGDACKARDTPRSSSTSSRRAVRCSSRRESPTR